VAESGARCVCRVPSPPAVAAVGLLRSSTLTSAALNPATIGTSSGEGNGIWDCGHTQTHTAPHLAAPSFAPSLPRGSVGGRDVSGSGRQAS
jgi:hypothetical protein